MPLPDRYVGATISEGTLRPEDLVPAFLAVLEEDQPTYEKLADEFDLDVDVREMDDDEISDLLGAIEDALNEAAPEGTYFGAHDGDPACFGFWTLVEGSDA